MIDLHTHTNFSDGADDYITLLKKAEKNNITHLAITDHDNCYVYNEMEKDDISKYYSGKIIPGVELKTTILGVNIELLGYGVDPKVINEKVKDLYIREDEKKKIELKRLYDVCVERGMKFEPNVIERYDEREYKYTIEYIHSEFKKFKENKVILNDDKSWDNSLVFYRRQMSNPNSRFYIDLTDITPDCEKVVKLIQDAGGLVFIPHVYLYKENSKSVFKHLVKNFPIDGVECFHSTYSDKQSNELLEYCKKHNLYVSGGTDYHGINKPEIELGKGKGNMEVSENVMNSWIGKVFTF